MAEIVLVNGSYTIKAGYADVVETTLLPSIVTPSKVRRVKQVEGAKVHAVNTDNGHAANEENIDRSKNSNGVVDGDVKMKDNGPAEVSQYEKEVIGRRGKVEDLDGLEVIWNYLLYEMLGWIKGEEGNVLLSEQLGMSRLDKEKMTQLLFEQFNVSGLFFAEESVLSLYAVGKVTGLSVDLGHSGINVVGVLDGQPMYQTATQIPWGGRDISEMVQSMIKSRTTSGAFTQTYDGVHDKNAIGCFLKEQIGRVAPTKEDFESLSASYQTSMNGESVDTEEDEDLFTLPDGCTIKVGKNERFAIGECMFQPEQFLAPSMSHRDIDFSGPSVLDAAIQAILNTPGDMSRRVLLDQIVVCGGMSRLKGFNERLHHELSEGAPGSSRPNIVQVPDYMDTSSTLPSASWIGGAILAKHVFAQQSQHITRNEYDEYGPQCIFSSLTRKTK